MATSRVSSRFYARVGGIVFIQEATPSFDIKSLSFSVNTQENTAYVKINGVNYPIDMEPFQLVPTVNYANDTDNAVVSLYGTGTNKILYHKAFVDEFVGLRLLQTDLMFANIYVSTDDKVKLPAYSNGEYIMTDKEKLMYDSYKSYEDSCKKNVSVVNWLIWESNDTMDTYIFTDKDQPITFSTEIGKIHFDGSPYYQFVGRDTLLIDTLELYNSTKEYINWMRDRQNTYAYNDTIINVINQSFEDEYMQGVLKIMEGEGSDLEKGGALVDYLDIYDQGFLRRLYMYFVNLQNVTINNALDSVYHINPKVEKKKDFISRSYMRIKDLMNKSQQVYYYPEITAIIQEMYDKDSNNYVSQILYDANLKLTPNTVFLGYIGNNIVHISTEKQTITNKLRKNLNYVYGMNPIVYNSSVKVCQWASFFRYAKKHYPREWNKFVVQVQKLKKGVPPVKTPISFDYSTMNENRQ